MKRKQKKKTIFTPDWKHQPRVKLPGRPRAWQELYSQLVFPTRSKGAPLFQVPNPLLPNPYSRQHNLEQKGFGTWNKAPSCTSAGIAFLCNQALPRLYMDGMAMASATMAATATMASGCAIAARGGGAWRQRGSGACVTCINCGTARLAVLARGSTYEEDDTHDLCFFDEMIHAILAI